MLAGATLLFVLEELRERHGGLSTDYDKFSRFVWLGYAFAGDQAVQQHLSAVALASPTSASIMMFGKSS